MAEVIRRAVFAAVTLPDEDAAVTAGSRRWRLPAAQLRELFARELAADAAYDITRKRLATLLAEAVRRLREAAGGAPDDRAVSALARGEEISALVDRHWPKQSAREVVTRLLTDVEFLARCADGLLDGDEQRALLNPDPGGPIRWSLADAFLLDEASGLLKRPKTYGHVVVDEAQDLSAMQCRAVARRCPTGSTTVLGDLAQATAPAAVGDWSRSLRAMGQPDARLVELTRGYRVPAQILDFANQLLPSLDVPVGGATSLRNAPDSLRLRRTTDLHADVAAVLSEAATREGSVGVICVDEDISALRRATMRAGIDTATVEQGMEAHVTLVPVTLCKGLEFDHVIVVEPGRIAALPRGLNWLYVALTRAVSTLTVVHTMALPRALDRGPEQVELGHVS